MMDGTEEREENVWWYDDNIQEGNVVVKVDGFVGVDDCEVLFESWVDWSSYARDVLVNIPFGGVDVKILGYGSCV